MSNEAISFNIAETVVKWVDVGIFVLDKNFEVQLWNNFMAHHSGCASDAIVGKNLFEAFPDLPKPWFTKKVNTVFSAEQLFLYFLGKSSFSISLCAQSPDHRRCRSHVSKLHVTAAKSRAGKTRGRLRDRL